VAGLDAGLSHNTWPLMDGRVIPSGLFILEPAWRNIFENVLTVQFQHRMLAYLILVLGVAIAVVGMRETYPAAVRTTALFVLLAITVQIAIGIWTLLAHVPIALGLIHQGGALLLVAILLWHLHAISLSATKR
jgi:cytochrome c oxidase assembly protein subunit 15